MKQLLIVVLLSVAGLTAAVWGGMYLACSPYCHGANDPRYIGR